MTDIPASSIVWLSIAAILLFSVPIVYFFCLRRRCQFKAGPVLCGVLGFFVFSRILETIPHIFCILLDNPVSRFINGNVIAYMLYGALMAGIFEECGRYIIMRFLLKKEKSRDTAIAYGIGHGGFEVYIISFAAIANYLIIAIMMKVLDQATALSFLGYSQANAASFDAILSSLAVYGWFPAMLAVIERILVMGIHITLSVVVFYGVKNHKIRYLFLAIVAHAILDAPAALYQKGAAPLWIVEFWLLVCLVALIFYARKLYQDMAESENE